MDYETVPLSDYERLCRMAKSRGLYVELRLKADGFSDVRLSNGMSEDLSDVNDRDRAARVLRGYLRTEARSYYLARVGGEQDARS